MARHHELLYALNSGGVDPEALARIDLEKMRLAGEHPVANLLTRVLGPISLRPGLQSILRIPGDLPTRLMAFELGLGVSKILLQSAAIMRVVGNDAMVQVPTVATLIATGSWTNVSTSPATASGGATLTFNATNTASARLRQAVTFAAPDQIVENILRVVVDSGPVVFRTGTTAGGEELVTDTILFEGTHKIAITPNAGTAYVELRADDPVTRSVSQIQFESTLIGGAGDLTLTTPWPAIADVDKVRVWPSLDVLFCGDGVRQQRRIEHRGDASWSLTKHQSVKGPYVPGNSRVSLTAAATSGNTTVTASEALFKAGHVGALLELTSSTGKTVNQTFTGVGQTSDYVTITGIDAGRNFYITGTGTAFVGTLVLERSFETGEPTVWSTYSSYVDGAATFARTTVADGQNNLRAHYRWRIAAYTSGSVITRLEYESGVQIGRARITGYTSPTIVSVEVLVALGNLNATRDWRLGAWSDVLGWPRVPVIHDGRMYWFQEDDVFGSVVDDYSNHDDNTEGDSGPIWRSIGAKSKAGVLWALSQTRLFAGTQSFEATLQASELDEPMSPSRYTVRYPRRRGSLDLPAVEHDDGFFFTQRSGKRIYEMSTPAGETRPTSSDMTRLLPNAIRGHVVDMAVQQQPDTRLYAVLDDGTCLVLTYDRDDKVQAWTMIDLERPGHTIERVVVLPNVNQDDVYFLVRRNFTERYLEKLAPEADQTSPDTCALLDAHKVLIGPVDEITGGGHLAGQTVQIWADGQRRADVTLDGTGSGALDDTYNRVVYGLGYSGIWKSVKLAYAAQLGTALGQEKIVHQVGVILRNSCLDGIRIGSDSNAVEPMPEIIDGAVRTSNQFFEEYDRGTFSIQSDWTADTRLYLSVDSAEGPFTLQAIVMDIETRDGAGAPASNG
jgi:hypothetical protein